MFTANAAVVLDRKALLARFRHHERQKEEFYFETTFRALQQRGLIESIEKLPDQVCSKAPAIVCGMYGVTSSGWAMGPVPMWSPNS